MKTKIKWAKAQKGTVVWRMDKIPEFKKNDEGKAPWDLLDFRVLAGVVEVMRNGAIKYEKHNWRKGTNWTRCFNAAMRHMVAWLNGEDDDPEWGLAHLDHAICSLMMLRGQILEGKGTDDRYRTEQSYKDQARQAIFGKEQKS